MAIWNNVASNVGLDWNVSACWSLVQTYIVRRSEDFEELNEHTDEYVYLMERIHISTP